jgi:hypothetical protein
VAAGEFDSFRTELRYLNDAVAAVPTKTLRDEQLRERLRTLSRVWLSAVKPAVVGHLRNTREFFKLSGELEKIAKLTSKYKPVAEYRRRLRTAENLASAVVLHLPVDSAPIVSTKSTELFLPSIPDLPTALVPSALIGSRSQMESFVNAHPFDKSVFLMIRYRKRNALLIKSIKASLRDRGLFAVLASDHQLTDDLYNAIACLLCCSKGLAIFDRAESSEIFNPNVAYELGMFHLLNRRCLILKHRGLKTLHTDILMKFYVPFAGPKNAAKCVAEWQPAVEYVEGDAISPPRPSIA